MKNYRTNLNLRQQIIEEACSWIGTRFHHQGRIKKTSLGNGGCDCIGLILGIAKKFNFKSLSDNELLIKHDLLNYSKFPPKNNLQAVLSKHFSEVSNMGLNKADIGLFKINHYPQHVALFDKVKGKKYLIHTYEEVGYVCKHYFSKLWQDRLVKIFCFNELLPS